MPERAFSPAQERAASMSARNKLTSPHWLYAADAYRAVGIAPDLEADCLPMPYGVVYCDRRVALGDDDFGYLGLALHDLGHYLVCPDIRRDAPNFGLGAHPSATEFQYAQRRIAAQAANIEEADASWVNVLLCREFFPPYVADWTAAELGFPSKPHVFHSSTLVRLERRGMLRAGSFYLPRELVLA